MEYKIDLGVWNSVFAVPAVIVDKHIRLAGAAQLKVLLCFLRHAGEGLGINELSSMLNMHEADVRDCLQYWVQTGVIAVNGDRLSPPEVSDSAVDHSPAPDVKPLPAENDTAVKKDSAEDTSRDNSTDNEITGKEEGKKRALSRPEKPDTAYIAERMKQDSDVAFLMNSADEIFGRITNHNDKATLLLIHEYDGLPVEVILMLLQYAADVGKCNMRYIEKTAINWADDEITTLQAAEARIKQLTNSRNAAFRVQRIIGAQEHSPTEKELSFADQWINRWKFSDEMIRAAYEICVDAKGKYIPGYTNSVLERWQRAGISTPEQAKAERQSRKKPKSEKGYDATYDIAEYESTSVTDSEW